MSLSSYDLCVLCGLCHSDEDDCDVCCDLYQFCFCFKPDSPLKQKKAPAPGFFKLDPHEDLVTTKILQSVSLAINTRLNLFVCMPCGTGHTAGTMSEHFSTKHPALRISRALRTQIDRLAEQADVAVKYPKIASSADPHVVFGGLSVRTSAGCPHCPYVAGPKPVAKHVRKAHPGSTLATEENVHAQVINPGATKILFRVRPAAPTAVEPQDSLLLEFHAFSWKAYSTTGVPNARMITPWLLRTQWHAHVLGRDPHVLCARVAMPVEPKLLPLSVLVTDYFDAATSLIAETDELVLQKLNTKDVAKR